MVDYSFRRFCHRFEEIILLGNIPPDNRCILNFTRTVDISLPIRRRDAYRDIFQRTSETSHGMAFEMRQHHGEIIARITFADYIIFQMFSTFERQQGVTFGIHYVNLGNRCETMFGSCLQVLFRSVAVPFISSVAFNDSAVDKLHQRAYKRRVEMVRFIRLAGRHLHGHIFPICPPAESLIHLHKVFRSYILDEINLRHTRINRFSVIGS